MMSNGQQDDRRGGPAGGHETANRVDHFDGASVPALLDYLDSPVSADRCDAACALGDRVRADRVRTKEQRCCLDADVCDRLAQLLDDPVPAVRFEAAIALAETHDQRATSTLLTAARLRTTRLDATRALGTCGDPAAQPALRALMRRWLLPWADRLQVAAALCALGDETGAQALEASLQSRRPAERAAAIHFLAESQHPNARQLLEGILGDRADRMRDVAARALGLLADPAAQTALTAALAETGSQDELYADLEQALRALEPVGKPSSL